MAAKAGDSQLQGGRPGSGAGPGWKDDPAGGHQVFRDEREPAGDAAGPCGRMVGDCPRTGSGGAHGGDQGESARNVVRVERTDDQRDAGVLSDSGTDSGDRVRASAAWWRPDDAHPYDLSGSDERLREEVSGALSAVAMRRLGGRVLLALSVIGGRAGH